MISPPLPSKPPARGGVAMAIGALLLVVGAIRCQTAPSGESDGGGDVGAYQASNEHYEAVYLGGGLATVGGVLLLVGLARRGRPNVTKT